MTVATFPDLSESKNPESLGLAFHHESSTFITNYELRTYLSQNSMVCPVDFAIKIRRINNYIIINGYCQAVTNLDDRD